MTVRNGIAKRREAPLRTPSYLGRQNVENLTAELNVLLADVFAIYVKTKNFHWHVSGPHFRDYHLLLDEQAEQVFAMTDDIAERVRKLGGTTIRSIGHVARLKHVADNDAEYVEPLDMIGELREDNRALLARMIEIHDLCEEANDVATASLLETWIDQTERRVWFLFETSRTATTA
jgi:starvation-inducible DNA-binding protein